MAKKIIYLGLLCAFLVYGYLIGTKRIFPLPQLLELKHYVEYVSGTFENQPPKKLPGSVEVHETALERLLIKKIPIPNFDGYGGGFSTSGNLLYIITNKGSVQTYDFENYTVVENDISDIPMNFADLILSGHPYKNNFNILRFRVNGVHSEYINSETLLLFVSHNAYDSDRDCITQNISRTELELNNRLVSQKNKWKTIFTASPCIDIEPDKTVTGFSSYPGHISGGVMVNLDEHNLLVSVGDYDRNGIDGSDEWAMDSTNPYGKFILVDKNSGKWSVYATGSRNATGLYIDRDSVIWSVENGPSGGDELNVLVKGGNYGWPRVSYGLWYDPILKLPGGNKEGTYPGYKKPVFSWIPSVAPRGLTKVEGAKFEYWKGDILMGTMRDQSLHRLRLDQDRRVVYDERIPIGHRIRDLTTLSGDKIALMTDDGYLLIIDEGGPVFHRSGSEANERMAALDNFDRFTNQKNDDSVASIRERSSRAIFQQNCAPCHNLNPVNQIGPNLHALFSREIGGVDNFNYSTTLERDTRTWNARLLRSFLANPEDEFPGIYMQKINLSSSEIDSLVHLFQHQNKNE